MSEVKKKCQVDDCSRAASTHCFCCNKNVCTRHFTEHIDGVKAQIDPLANDINTIVEKMQTLTIESLIEAPFARLKQWKIDMHQLIDEIFLVKTKEIEELVENNQGKFVEYQKSQLEGMMKMQDDVRQLAEDGDATLDQIQSLKSQLTDVQTKLTSFKKDFLSVDAKVLADGLVTVRSNLKKISPPRHKKNYPPPQNPRNSQNESSFGSFGSATNAGQQSSGFASFGGAYGFKSTQPQAAPTSSLLFGATPTNASPFSGAVPTANVSPLSFGGPTANASLFSGGAPTPNASLVFGASPTVSAFGSNPNTSTFGTSQTPNQFPFNNKWGK